MEYQRTLAGKVILEGEGIFSGKNIKVEIEPAEENTGINFIRADLPKKPVIPLNIENVIGLEGAVALTDGEHFIYLIEHLLSAFHGLQIDNAIVKVYGEEIPLFDGSAYPWVRKIQEVGYKFSLVPKKKFYLRKSFQYQNGSGKIIFKPSNTLKIKASIFFEHVLIGHQSLEIEINPRSYINEISFARTFGFKDILFERKNKGIIKGGSLSNAIILDRDKILNPEGLRIQDEFIRHKILDIIGDLFTLGHSLVAEIEAVYSNHRLHVEALKSLYKAGLLEEVESRALAFLLIYKKLKKAE
ncbi:MAG: UDP-3-O-[3-hydroxymyristoyl] N-acetylglucosamine deacetylase [Thermodesulfobacterium geofontis]|uniref:UDP-3-O-acyl-N-acetylglucosamine deacetylase n=1 Tax=Thermodesulfobacterium geofontis TaxID=1295609 RepID=A0A2N7PNW7_9BACT|nr:MAG: UDP-3-O-[3-hydroxymyristoyl] N-acetylglucosamine deacetylase [Thermodesulfobacterium geofontis]